MHVYSRLITRTLATDSNLMLTRILIFVSLQIISNNFILNNSNHVLSAWQVKNRYWRRMFSWREGLTLKFITNLLGMCRWNFPSLYSPFLKKPTVRKKCKSRWLDQGDWKTDLLSLDPPRQNDHTHNRHKIWRRDHSFEEFMHSMEIRPLFL